MTTTTTQSNQMMTMNNINNDYSSDCIVPSPTRDLEENVALSPSLQILHTSHMDIDFTPQNTSVEYPHIVKNNSSHSSKLLRTRSNQNVSKRKRKQKIHMTTHVIDGWTIEESFEPFEQQESKSSPSKKQEKTIHSANLNVHQFDIDEVCEFFNFTFGENTYTEIIKEHLIDGIALLLLQEQHLSNTFKMPSEHRQILLKRICELKNGASI